MDRRLPENVERFLARYVGSVDQLEILLLLRAESARFWSAPEVGDRLRRPEPAARARLELMVDQGLLEREDDRFRYAPGGRGVDVDSVERCFATRRAAVISAIFADG